jgi:hypothetical protein
MEPGIEGLGSNSRLSAREPVVRVSGRSAKLAERLGTLITPAP